MVYNLLNAKGHMSVQAVDGVDAIEKVTLSLSEGGFDLILMDYQMPRMNGPEACKAIRDLGFSGLIVGVTGIMATEEKDEFIPMGAHRVFSRPMLSDLLLLTAIALLKGYRDNILLRRIRQFSS
jgi:CheY-like chemotaxis protein